MTKITKKMCVLEQTHSISTLLYLIEHDGCRKIDIYRDVSHNNTMPEKLNRMEDIGLIRQEPMGRGHLVHLTEQGRQVALQLAAVNRIMGDSVDRNPSDLDRFGSLEPVQDVCAVSYVPVDLPLRQVFHAFEGVVAFGSRLLDFLGHVPDIGEPIISGLRRMFQHMPTGMPVAASVHDDGREGQRTPPQVSGHRMCRRFLVIPESSSQ